jgi:hypothetical protein
MAAIDAAQQHSNGRKLVMPRHDRRLDRIFFSVTSLLMSVVVFLGFSRTYFLAGVFRAPLPSFTLHVHAVAFSLWLPLLVVQTTLISAGRADIHRKLGIAGFLLGCFMVIIGVLAANDSLARSFPTQGRTALSFYIVPLTDMLIFGTLLFLAFLKRRNFPAHKRLIYLATTALLPAAIGRMPLPGASSGTIVALYSYIFLLALAIYDLRSMRKVQPVTIWASAFMIFVHHLRYPIAETAAWQAFAMQMAHLGR